MLYVDNRAGSSDLTKPLIALGVAVEATRLEFSDVMFEGRGEKGKPVSVGVEFKQLRELVQALRTERLQGYQMPGMRNTLDYSYLLIEGELLYDSKGRLQRREAKGRWSRNQLVLLEGNMTVSELLKRVYVMHLCGGLNPLWTLTRHDTLQAILALYHTWTDTDLDKHKSHLGIYNAPALVPISDVRHTFKTLPTIGRRVSLAVEQHFGGSLKRAVNAGVDEWASIQIVDDEGRSRRLGMKAARQIVSYCEGDV